MPERNPFEPPPQLLGDPRPPRGPTVGILAGTEGWPQIPLDRDALPPYRTPAFLDLDAFPGITEADVQRLRAQGVLAPPPPSAMEQLLPTFSAVTNVRTGPRREVVTPQGKIYDPDAGILENNNPWLGGAAAVFDIANLLPVGPYAAAGGLAKLAMAVAPGVAKRAATKAAKKSGEQLGEIASRQYVTGDVPVKATKDAPPNPAVQTVRDPYRMMYPGIYKDPRQIVREASERLVPEGEAADAMKRLFGVSRGDLDEIVKGRVGNVSPHGVILPYRGTADISARNVITPENTQRLIDVLAEAGKIPGLRHSDAWYVMDPVFHRLVQMFGPEEAVKRYRHLNAMTGMASTGSDVPTEIQRGTAAHWLQQQDRFEDFLKFGGMAAAKRGSGFPPDMRYIRGHPYHSTSQTGLMQKYLEAGELRSGAPKVPLYVAASGVPETGFQTRAPVGDSHFSRAVGLADTRKGPRGVQASLSRSEYETLQPWWQNQVAGALGMESIPAQSRTWTTFGPQTGVKTGLGQGKLELLSQQIMVAAKRHGISPETARDLVLSGGAGAGVLALGVGGLAPPSE